MDVGSVEEVLGRGIGGPDSLLGVNNRPRVLSELGQAEASTQEQGVTG
jgi:hypothetical protein